MEILQCTIPASSHYAMGRMHYYPSSTWYQTETYTINIEGVTVKAKKIGSTKENMREVYYKVGGNGSFKIGIDKDELLVEIAKTEKKIEQTLDKNITPNAENLRVARKIWKRDIQDCLEEALATLMTSGRFSPKERRFFAKKLLDKKVITLRMLVDFTDSLMI